MLRTEDIGLHYIWTCGEGQNGMAATTQPSACMSVARLRRAMGAAIKYACLSGKEARVTGG